MTIQDRQAYVAHLELMRRVRQLYHSLGSAVRSLNIDITDSEIQSLSQDVVRRYEEPHREYHTIEHVYSLIAALGAHMKQQEKQQLTQISQAQLMLACVYHDCIYVPGSLLCEQLSAAYVHDVLIEVGIKSADVAPIARAIERSARHHDRNGASVMENLFLDSDLYVFAQSREDFLRSAQQIRDESVHGGKVSNTDYVRGRRSFLGELLMRNNGRIYHSASFIELNSIAVKNIEYEISTLK